MRKFRGSIFTIILLLVVSQAFTALRLQAEEIPDQPVSIDPTPRFVIEKQIPTGLIHGIEFSPDSRLLYTAGVDKTVDVWTLIERAGLQDGDPERLEIVKIKSIPWEVSRGARGTIFTMDLAGDRIAIGGYSARAGGQVILIDRPQGEVQQALPAEINRNASGEITNGHSQTLIESAFSASGQKLMTMSRDYEMRLWAAPDWQSTLISPASGEAVNRYYPMQFFGDDHFALAQGTRVAVGRFENGQLSFPPENVVRNRDGNQHAVNAISNASAGQQWVSGSESGELELWKGFDRPQKIATLRKNGPTPIGLRISLNGNWLAVANHHTQPALELWDLSQQPPVLFDTFRETTISDVPLCRFSPDGNYLVSQHGEPGTFHLFDLRDSKAGALSDPDSRRHYVVQNGDSILDSISFVKQLSDEMTDREYFLRLRSRNGQQQIFDLKQNEKQRAEDFLAVDFREVNEMSGGWALQQERETQSTTDDAVLLLRHPQLGSHRITLDRGLQGDFSTYCWIVGAPVEDPDVPGQLEANLERPVAVAIGTSEQYGIFIYRLPQQAGQAVEYVRYYRDHQDAVISLACSDDGRILASAGQDQLVKFWNLDGIADFEKTPPQIEWGADFSADPQGLRVERVTKGGIAQRRSLQKDDVITQLTLSRTGVRNLVAVTARDMNQLLQEVKPGEEVLMDREREGMGLTRRVTPAWEPFANMYLDPDNHWILYSPTGYFTAGAIEGDKLINYQINRGAGQPPRLVKAAQLRLDFDRSKVGDTYFFRLFEERNEQAVAEQLDLPLAANEHLRERIEAIPEIRIVQPRLGEYLAAEDSINLVIEVTLSEGEEDLLDQWLVDANGIAVQAQPVKEEVDKHRARYTWTGIPRDYCSSLTTLRVRQVEAKRDVPVRNNFYAEYAQAFLPEVEFTETFRAHLLTVTCEDYPGPVYQPLQRTHDDADEIVKLFQQDSPHYSLRAEHIVRLNEGLQGRPLSRKDVEAAIETISENVLSAQSAGDAKNKSEEEATRDIVFVFLAGHGEEWDDHFAFMTEGAVNKIGENDPPQHIPWSVFQELRNIPAATVFIMDSCHSHAALREFSRDAEMMNYLAITATSEQTQYALVGAQNGEFTNSFKRAASNLKYDTMPDYSRVIGSVELPELIEFVKSDLRERTGGQQIPDVATRDNLGSDTFFIPLFRALEEVDAANE